VAGPLNMRVTLNGTLGSGKSTVGKELARRLGVRYISTGQIFRELGHISNPDVLQTNLEAESNSALDDAVDNKVRELNKTVADFVIDSRMAWHFIDDALHVFLSVTPEVAARRVMRDRTRLNEQYASMEAALEALRARRDSELKRYRRLYGVDIENPENYQLSVITDDAEVPDVVDVIMHRVEGATKETRWIPKTRLVPMNPAPRGVVTANPEPPRLPVCLAGNFGFYFDDPASLLGVLRNGPRLVPYEHVSGDYPSTDDVMTDARLSLELDDLRQWESLAGMPLAFTKMLPGFSTPPDS
jgi:predicted cytidylate kinase